MELFSTPRDYHLHIETTLAKFVNEMNSVYPRLP